MSEVDGEQARLLGELTKRLRARLPGNREVATRAISQALAGHTADQPWIKSHFSELVEKVQLDAYADYVRAENEGGRQSLVEHFSALLPPGASAADAINVVADQFSVLDRFFLSLTQGRRPRAGKVFETLIRDLFGRLGYPYTSQAVIDGQPDFVLPSAEHFARHAMDCVIFTVKRTLRERWRQIVTEGTQGLGFFLATIDDSVSARDLNEMLRTRVTLVVPAGVKALQRYDAVPNVITFENFFQHHLDPAVNRWRATGIV